MKLDIIIPCYNAKKTIESTLESIAKQKEIKDVSVYLVNDCSDYDYSSYLSKYSPFFSIQEIALEKNLGPGGARNEGIKHSHNPYLIFIDSDDYFYNDDSISTLYHAIEKEKADLVISNFIYERDGERTIKKQDFIWLHGKIYRRSFLKKHSIFFNETRANEDNGFNRLILFMKPTIHFIDIITYVYCENKDSITRKDNRLYRLKGLEGYTYNMYWAIEEGMKRGCDAVSIVVLSMSVLICMYYYYLELFELYDNVDVLFEWSYDLLKVYQSFPEHTLKKNHIQMIMEKKEKEYQERGISLNRILSFDEFLGKVDKVKK